jgi:hypothetical protein
MTAFLLVSGGVLFGKQKTNVYTVYILYIALCIDAIPINKRFIISHLIFVLKF